MGGGRERWFARPLRVDGGYMRLAFSRWQSALLVCSLIASGGAQAQAQVPTREEINPEPPEGDADEAVSVDASGAFTRGPCPLDESDVRASIVDVQFSGPNGAPLAPALAAVVQGLEAPMGEQPIRIVCDVRDRANAALRQARYIATVQIPPQRIEDGILRLEIISGRIVQTRVRGDAGPLEALVESRIRALEALDPLNEADAERILLLADDVPGLSVNLTLQPAGGAPGDLIGELTVNYDRFQVLANVQNYNSRQLGRETAYVRGEINGLTGLGDVTYIAASSTFDFEEQRVLQLGHSMLLDDGGLSLSLNGTFAESRPDLDTIELRTRSWLGGIQVGVPLARSLRRDATLELGYEHIEQRTVVLGGLGAVPLNLDQIRAVSARVRGAAREFDSRGRERYSVRGFAELRKGLDIFGATETGVFKDGFSPSRFEGSATATIARAEVDMTIGMGPIFDLAADLRGQWADEPLLNYDEFSIGNLTVGRGYDPGANTGDRAWGASFELRANLPASERFGTQVYGFFDSVELWNLDQNSTERNRVLQSVGGGVRFSLPGALQLDVTYARPLDPPLLAGAPNNDAPDRLLFSLTTRLLPFGVRR